MKHIYSACFFLCMIYLAAACGDSKEKEKIDTTTQTAPAAEETKEQLITRYSPKLQKIIKTDEGALRGIDFGDDLEKVFMQEDTIPLEDSARFVSFTVDLGNEEITDVLYYYDNNRKIRGFTLDMYLNDKSSVDSLSNDLAGYFTQKYGKPVIQEKKAIAWNGPHQVKIVMRDVGIKEAPGLQVQIAKSNSN